MRIIALTSGRNVPSARFRVRQYLPALRDLGVDVVEFCPVVGKYSAAPSWVSRRVRAASGGEEPTTGARVLRDVRRQATTLLRLGSRFPGVVASRSADAVWMERELLSGRMSLEAFTGRPRFFDVDDALWLHGTPGFSERIASACDVVIAGNSYLSEHYAHAGARQTVVIPTSVDTDLWCPSPSTSKGSFVIGWMGTSSNLPFLEAMEPALAAFVSRHADAVLLVVCDKPPQFSRMSSAHWRFERWSPEREVELTRQMTVGLMPLPNTEWARGKCSLKMLLYMAVGIPSIVSPVGSNCDILAHGEVAVAATDQQQWTDGLERLYGQEKLRRDMGALAREIALREYSVRTNARKLAHVFRSSSRATQVVELPR